MRPRLQQGESAPALAAGLTESVALPMLIRQTSGVPTAIDVGLPESIQHAINDVIRRTRLWTHEKGDVAGELTAHFQDGLDSGRSAKELIQSFGPVRTAARLIRRSRLRCRPWPWRVWRRSWQCVVGAAMLLLACWIALVVPFRSAAPNITFDLVAEHDAVAVAIPAQDRGWPLYREGLIKLGPTQHEAFAAYTGEDDIIAVLQKGPDSPDWPQAADFLNQHNESVGLFLRATARLRFGFVHRTPDNIEWIRWQGNPNANEYNPPGTYLSHTLLAHIQELRIVRPFLAGRMFSAAVENDGDTVLRCLSGLLKLGEHSKEDGFTISTLAGISHVRLASKCLAWIVQSRPQLFDDRQLSELNRRLAAVSKTDWKVDAAADNQLFFDDFLQHAYSPNGRFTAQGFRFLQSAISSSSEVQDRLREDLWYVPEDDGAAEESIPFSEQLIFDVRGSEAAAWIADRDEIEQKFVELQLMRQKDISEAEPTNNTSAYDAELARLNDSWILRRRYLPILMFCQFVGFDTTKMRRWKMSPLRMIAARDGAIVAIALEKHRRDHDKWPQHLSALQPEYMNTLPADPMSDQPLQFKIIEGIPHLYSVGPDQVDNGGTPVENWPSETTSGDWLLLPVSLD
ncbi:MAG: hypothetical protein GY878_25745 [Fuerstiella sp.]|nr:hypothetical protein [Fuerstiella sp.]